MSDRTFKNSGVRFGRVKGVDLWAHWTLLLWFGYVLYLNWLRQNQTGWEAQGTSGVGEALLRAGGWWLAVFATILVHEAGHCVAAHRQGGGADAIVLWPLGGLAYCDAPHLAWNQFWVAAGGPLAQLLPTALAGLAILVFKLDASPFPTPGESMASVIVGAYFWWNVTILAFNLIPLYPLDGGRMFQAVLWGKLRNYGRATLLTVWVSRATLIAALIVAIIWVKPQYSWATGLILLWALFETQRLYQRLVAGEDEDNPFGYDFSRGYTSLERTATRDRPQARASARERLRTRLREGREVREADVRRRVDALLEKISREGLQSLTHRERKFLERASRRFQRPQG